MKRIILLVLMFTLVLPASVFAANRNLLDDVTVTILSDTIEVGGTVTLEFKVKESTTSGLTTNNILVESGDPSILKVEGSGGKFNVTGVSAGAADVVFPAYLGYGEQRFTFLVGDTSTGTEDTDYGDLPQEMIDFVNYGIMLEKASVLEEKATSVYNKNKLVNNHNRKQAYIEFNTVIVPNYTKFVVELKKITAPNDELQKLHNMFLQGAKLQLEGFTIMKQVTFKPVIKNGAFSGANKKLDAGAKYITAFLNGIDAYQQKYDPNY